MESVAGLWLSILVLLAGAGLGRLARGFRRREDESLDERLVFDTAVGLGVYSLVMFAFGALQLLHWKYFIMTLVVPACLGFAVVVPDLFYALPGFVWRKQTRADVLCGLLLLVLAVAALVPAMAPPAMSDWDSLAYHLSVPKLYIEHGGFRYISFSSHSNFPSLMEMLYVPALYMHQPVAAKMVNYWVGVLLVAAVALLARRHFGAGSAWMAAIALAGMPIVLWEATTAYVDLATALYTVVSVHLLLNYASRKPSGRRCRSN
jgi:4-amino-4-deoxy-L-arabinose transferase-like glycosyltransferase